MEHRREGSAHVQGSMPSLVDELSTFLGSMNKDPLQGCWQQLLRRMVLHDVAYTQENRERVVGAAEDDEYEARLNAPPPSASNIGQMLKDTSQAIQVCHSHYARCIIYRSFFQPQWCM